jgi:acetoin utilization deacetylase AcuC-like enzyme
VVDFDVHHGNGTQDIFADDPRVLYISSHAFPFYPGTGALDEVGHGEGTGYTVNVPMPQGMGDADFACLYSEVVEPIAGTFAPELVLVSAGFDAHRGDPLAGMDLTAAGYSFLMSLCASVADASAKGRIVAALEGGYGLDGIADASAAVVQVLLGDRVDPEIAAPDPSTRELASAYRRHFARFWPQALAP